MCAGRAIGITFLYLTQLNEKINEFMRCGTCKSVFVDPLPGTDDFALMYEKSTYHDRYYDREVGIEYLESARLLRQHMHSGETV